MSPVESGCDDSIRAASRRKYRSRAPGYDRTVGPTWPIREQAIAGLHLQPGQRVLDVGCGTGLSLALLRQGVGHGGSVVGIDHSPDMLQRARARVADAGWPNVSVLEVPAQDLVLAQAVDALLFHYTHDVLRSAVALDHVLRCARPGARVAVAGIKFFPPWMAPLNAWVYLKNRGYNGAPGELATPWDRIAPRLRDWQMRPTQWGMGYLAFGRVADPQSST
jgi:demethylmenaquinone methyltransferase/2-methoxy-6-polyprenyl-1,4-benzoquinol methylase